MRIKVGRIVDVDKPINLADLSPLDRIIAAATNAYRNTPMYRRRYAETEERKEEQKRKVRETLSEALLTVIGPELDRNKTLANRGDTCRAILVKVPARFEAYLSEVVGSHEFDAYDVVVVHPSRTIRKFCTPPCLVYIEAKEGAK